MKFRLILATPLALSAFAEAAFADKEDYRREACANFAQSFYADWEAKTEVKALSTRSDGTHPINGKIYLETSAKDFQCSFDSSNNLVDFHTEGRSWAAFVRHGRSPYNKTN